MTCIITKYLGPTNTRGARVKATSYSGSVTVAWDYALNPEANALVAMNALARKFGLWGAYVRFDSPTEHACDVWVRAEYQDDGGMIPYPRFEVRR